MTLFLPSGPLEFPVGVQPGIDPDHIALSRGGDPLISAVKVGNGFLNLVTGDYSVAGGKDKILGRAGPVRDYTGTGADSFVNALPTTPTPTALTQAVIVTVTPFAAANKVYAVAASAGTQFYIAEINTSGGVFGSFVVGNLGLFSWNPIVGHTYFFAIAGDSAGTVIAVATDMTTGQIFQGTPVATGGNFAGFSGNYTVGGNASDYISAATLISRKLTQFELNTWAADPWSFWYPKQPIVPVDVDDFIAVAPSAFTWFHMDTQSNYPRSLFMRDVRAHD